MATIRRAGFGTVFELEDSKVGIGTDAATHTLQALGNIRSEAATDIGISSLTTYQGFVDKEARFTAGQIDIESQSGSTSGEIVIDGDVTVSSATTFTSGPQNLTVTDTFTLPSGDTNSREEKPTAGSLRFNQDFATLEFYTGNNWATVNTFTEMQNSPGSRGRGLIGGGYDGSNYLKDIQKVQIATLGNAINNGELSNVRARIGSVSNETRGIWAGGQEPSYVNTIEYRAIASEGIVADFGNLSANRGYMGCLSSSTRGVFAGGYSPSPTNNVNVMEYVEITTIGDAVDFGDLANNVWYFGTCSSPTRGIFAGGVSTPNGLSAPKISNINFITIASKGNSTNFGNLISRRSSLGGGYSSGTRGVFAGGSNHSEMDYITIASTGNATKFGDLSSDHKNRTSFSSKTRGITAGGRNPAATNVIEFAEIATTGNAQDFGDLTQLSTLPDNGGLSDSHGGLGGF